MSGAQLRKPTPWRESEIARHATTRRSASLGSDFKHGNLQGTVGTQIRCRFLSFVSVPCRFLIFVSVRRTVWGVAPLRPLEVEVRYVRADWDPVVTTLGGG